MFLCKQHSLGSQTSPKGKAAMWRTSPSCTWRTCWLIEERNIYQILSPGICIIYLCSWILNLLLVLSYYCWNTCLVQVYKDSVWQPLVPHHQVANKKKLYNFSIPRWYLWISLIASPASPADLPVQPIYLITLCDLPTYLSDLPTSTNYLPTYLNYL